MVKAPSFQFYPADWLNDIKLQTCDMAAQGILINMMCLMHQSSRYGYLMINGSKPNDKTIIKLLRTHHKTFIKGTNQLLLSGALQKTEEGVYYCKRMVEDETLRHIRREAGKKGGNPALLNQKDNQNGKQKATPSSSSSLSSSNLDPKELPTADLQENPSKHFKDQISDDDYLNRLNNIGEELTKLKSDFNWWQMIQHYFNKKRHPEAVIDVLGIIKGYLVTDTLKNTPWGLANKLMPIKSQNYNEQDTRRAHEAIKNQIKASPEIAGIAAKMFSNILGKRKLITGQ